MTKFIKDQDTSNSRTTATGNDATAGMLTIAGTPANSWKASNCMNILEQKGCLRSTDSATAGMPANGGMPATIGIQATRERHVWKSAEFGDAPGRPPITGNPVTAGLPAAEGRQKQQGSQQQHGCHVWQGQAFSNDVNDC